MNGSVLQSIRLGTRGSMLARAQSGAVARMLEARHPGLQVQLVPIRTTGDVIADKPLHEVGGKGLFTKELEQALLSQSIDFAVHSFKDVPVTMPLVDQAELVITSIPEREDPRDVLVSVAARSITELGKGSHIGTGSLRRRCQLLHRRSDLVVDPIRGNIDTRLRKCLAGEQDAIVLAMAGTRRAGIFDEKIMTPIDPSEMLPAAGQGALALQCRRDDIQTRELLGVLNHPPTATCVMAERELVRLLDGDCHSPIAALATIHGSGLKLSSVVGSRGGQLPLVAAQHVEASADALALAKTVFEKLASAGVQPLLR